MLNGLWIAALSVIVPTFFLFLFGTVPQIFGMAPSAVYFSLLMALGSLANLPVILYFNRKHGLNVWSEFSPLGFRNFLLLFVLSVVILFLLPVFSQLVLSFKNFIHQRAGIFLPGIESFAVSFVVFSIGKIFIAPFVEELLFRGIIFRLLKENYSLPLSVVVSSLLFAGVHFNYSDLDFLFIYGVIFCLVYFKTKSLWAPIVLHIMINFYSQTTLKQEFSLSPQHLRIYAILVLLSGILGLCMLKFIGKDRFPPFYNRDNK